ncbi:hypothetical protein C7S16_2992 [Burkholderia thailandensis]|uniref:Uncharacterized protein n=1 Tax=Burkholderia thailandensis TaxID=57975 RepID=A0AAW9D1K8_BURTH|nr:hypothetical protein [Burkholderia thailandensis]MDW9254914.1 hypothetical protein [Burkholderia thailandensis]
MSSLESVDIGERTGRARASAERNRRRGCPACGAARRAQCPANPVTV